jgi:hypothetical protein
VNIENLAFANGDVNIDWTGGRELPDPVGTVNVGIISGDFDLDAVITALSTRSNVTVETRAGATTTNFQMIPVEVVEETAYVSGTDVEIDDNGNIIQSITTSTVTTGFQMQLLPRVLNTREILLRYSLNLSDLVDLKTFEATDSSVQLPEVSRSSTQHLCSTGVPIAKGTTHTTVSSTLVAKLTSDQNMQPDFTSANHQHSQPL